MTSDEIEIKRPRLKSLIGRHEVFEEYFIWLKGQSKRNISETTLEIKFSNLVTLENNYSLDLDGDSTNIAEVTTTITLAGLKNATANLYRLALRQWSEFKGLTLGDSTRTALQDKKDGNGDSNKEPKIESKDLISPEEFGDIIAHMKDPSLEAFFAVLYDAGSRPGETVALNVGDVRPTEHGYEISFRRGTKTEQSHRTVLLGVVDERCNRIFGKWYQAHPLQHDINAPLFINREGGRLAQDVATHRLNYHEERLRRGKGNEKCALHLYLFRKSAITMMLRQKRLSEIEIKLRIGHKRDSSVLETYYDLRDADDQKNAQLQAKGIVVKEADYTRLTCDRCNTLNEVGIDVCHKCGYPMTAEARVREYNAQRENIRQEVSEEWEEQFRKLREDITTIKEDVLKRDKELKKQIIDAVTGGKKKGED